MRKINPLFVAAGLCVLIIIGSINLKNNSVRLDNSIIELNNMIMITNNYKDMKENWFDGKKIETNVANLINDKSFSSTKIDKRISKNSIKLNLATSNKEILGVFVTKIMNEKFEVHQFKFSDSFVSFEIGVQ
jgi:hypothetical protein